MSASGRSRRGARRGAGVSRALGAVAAGAAALLALSACSLLPTSGSGSSGEAGGTATSQANGSTAVVPQGLERFYEQEPTWSPCSGSYECATIDVPLDYADPTGDTIEIALSRTTGTNHEKALVLNPGGPGGSGIDLLQAGASWMVGDAVSGAYDLVGFDPRGVGRSTAVVCQTDAEQDADRANTIIPSTDAQIETILEQYATDAKTCATRSPAGLLEHVDTTSSARDLDVIRAVLGQDKLDYLGYSYGTKLGATYLKLFPDNAGRMVLDGAMDPTLGIEQVTVQQAEAFEKALDVFLEDCLAGNDCPFTGALDQARAQLTALVTDANTTPLSSDDGRPVNAAEIYTAVMLPMYEPAYYGQLREALAAGLDGDGTQLLALADQSNDRQSDGSYSSNSNAAFQAINCVDYTHLSGSLAAVKERAAQLKKAAPFWGPAMAYDDGCSSWTAPAVDAESTFEVSEAIPGVLVVGTTGDPATPYAWAKALQSLLPGSSLLTYEGDGHTAFGRSNTCISDAVSGYLVSGTLPANGTTC